MVVFRQIGFNQISKSLAFLISKRNNSVKVRFAPSPTGYLHLGGLRTALYNHLFALSHNGKTLLRIEDTDQDRKVDGAVNQLVEDLSWCGLNYDEGPLLQSERLSIYKENVDNLINNGSAYYCFCTSTRLDILRREAVKAGLVPKYDNRCRSLSKDDVSLKLMKNTPHCIRFKLSHCNDPFHDLVYGDIYGDVASLEGDPIILKTDGFPTYHLANVVDDHYMGISHVLRGVEWQGSTQKHLLLYKAFGWTPPIFAHLPLLMNPDGTKLSKRQGDVDVRHYRNKGVFPLALLNFVIRAGGGFDMEQWERDSNSFTLDQLIHKFDITKMNGSSCKVNLQKLDVSNQLELQRKLENNIETKQLVSAVQLLVSKEFINSEHSENIDISEKHILKILNWTKIRISYLQDLVAPAWRFLWVLPKPGNLTPIETQALAQLSSALEKSNFEAEEIKSICKNCSTELNIKFSKLMKLLRHVLSGLNEGPSIAEMMEVLGKETVLLRLAEAQSPNSKIKSVQN